MPERQPYRQLTLGEAMAVTRAVSTEALAPARAVDVDRLVDELEAIDVCAVCGWSRRAHSGSHRPITCGLYTTAPPVANREVNTARIPKSPMRWGGS